MSRRSKYCLLGIPDHQGVVHVGGRLGAASGPSAFRGMFARLSGRTKNFAGVNEVTDVGDVRGLGADVGANHELAAELLRAAHPPDGVSVVVGGGHDHGYSQLLGISRALANARGKGKRLRLGCINIDAHLDVRKAEPVISSGSPFYLAIESGVLDPKNFIEFGIQSHCNGPALWEYIERKKIEVVGFEKLRDGKAVAQFKKCLSKLEAKCDVIVISLDLDAAAQAFAPGVSAPQSEGFAGGELVQMAELAGRSRKVVSLGLFELNPEHDVDDCTARLGATAAWHFFEQAASRMAPLRSAARPRARATVKKN